MTLASGTRLGSYEILSPLGAGGMGEVYRARDTRLGRDVAIKVLPDMFAGDGDRMARLEREAQLLAALSHPNIATIFGIEDTSGARALVMELVDGPTLQERLQTGAMPIDEALRFARQIAEALEYAHERGIIHRDLKPANVKVTGDGQVKVLDFGLAKALEGTPAGSGISDSPTLSLAATAMGVILGTAAYMSPEQAKGKPVDKRTDIFAFGCLLFEMLTGRRTFEGEDVSETLACVIMRQPDWSALPQNVSPSLTKLLRRCLEKDRKKRLADIADARLEIDEEIAHPWSPATTDTAPAAPPAPVVVKKWSPLAIGAGVVAGALLAAGGAWAVARWTPPPPAQPMRFSVATTSALPLQGAPPDRNVAISPDGKYIAYVAGIGSASQLMIRAVDQLEAQPLTRGVTGARHPFFSPDSRWVGFFLLGELKKVAITGGPALPLCKTGGTSPPRGASWGPDNTIVFATADLSTGLMSVPAGGGDPKPLTKPDPSQGEADHLHPFVLPDGQAVLFTIASTSGADGSQIGAMDLKSGQRKTLVRGGSHPEYVETGHVVYTASGTLRAVRFDANRLEVQGDAMPVVEGVASGPAGVANYSISRTGTLAFVSGTALDSGTRRLVWVNRQGQEEPLKAPPREYNNPRISPDGARIAVRSQDEEDDIWIWDVARQTLSRLTFDPGSDIVPVWTPDSRRVIYRSTPQTPQNGAPNAGPLFWRNADGTGSQELIAGGPTPLFPWVVSPDGKTLVLAEQKGTMILSTMSLGGSGSPKIEPLLQSKFSNVLAELSPDGRWIAYMSSESGTNHVYVRPFPNVNAGRWQVSTTIGNKPAWSRNGRELFYQGSGELLSVPVQISGATFSFGTPTKVFDWRYYNPPQGRHYDVSADGQRFLVISLGGTETSPVGPPPSITLVLNWFEELKARTK